MSDELVKLGWEIRGDDVAEAHTPFGSYRVEKTQYFGWHWSYCFDEYYDSDRLSCEDMGEGMSLAEGHWRRCVQPITKPLTDRIEELEAENADLKDKLAKAVWLVERAFNEGFGEGMNDVLRHSGGKTWYDSRSRKRLEELTGGMDGF